MNLLRKYPKLFLRFKNLTIKNIAMLIGLISLALGLLATWIQYLIFSDISFVYFCIAFVVIASLCIYYLSLSIIEFFVYRKIKLIYKIIRRTKLGKNNYPHIENIDQALMKVDEDVQEWVNNASTEITNLKGLADYRKQFVSNLSHELKTPLFSVQGYLQSLLEGGLYDEKINLSFLKKAYSNTNRLQEIVEGLKEIHQMEESKLQLKVENFGILKLINKVVSDMESLLLEKEIKISYKSGADEEFEVKGDKHWIEKVISNLVTNAIKYNIQGGGISFAIYDMSKSVLVEIADTGHGISNEHLPHLFDRFYRIDSSRSRDQGGSGLGLAIVKHILEAHGHTVNVRSDIGSGSTFGFTLSKPN